jgi:hypothetical protein
MDDDDSLSPFETFDLEEAARLSALGIIDGRTMIPAGLVPPPDDHPFWPEVVGRLERKQALDQATWAMLEKAMHPAHPSWDDVAPHLLERSDWARRHAAWASQAAHLRGTSFGRIQHGGGVPDLGAAGDDHAA